MFNSYNFMFIFGVMKEYELYMCRCTGNIRIQIRIQIRVQIRVQIYLAYPHAIEPVT
jgi:hypothetical protein